MGGKVRATAKTVNEEDFNHFEEDGDDVKYSSDEAPEEIGINDETAMNDSGRLRFRADIALDSEEYAGKKSSRKAAFEEGEEGEEDEELASGDAADATAKLSFALEGGAHSPGNSDEEDEEEASKRTLLGGQDDELAALNREYEKLREEDEQGFELLKAQERDSHEKGQAVRNQRALWDRSLEARIALQKILGGANRLPGEHAMTTLCQENEQVKLAYTQLADSAEKTLNSLLDLETLLFENNDAITRNYSSSPNVNGKREASGELDTGTVIDTAWKRMDGLYSKLAPYRDNALDRWQRKTQIYSGAVGRTKLRAFNQSVSQQVAATMRDTSRLIGRMRLKRDSVHVLGQQMEEEAKENPSANIGDDADELFRSATAVEDDGDPETFDDSEFYQQLLREFLEQSDPSALGNMSLYSSARKHNKKRKKVDRRASKGRKLRYNVFPLLVNFMAPKPKVVPAIASQLFSNLFGQKSKTVSSTA